MLILALPYIFTIILSFLFILYPIILILSSYFYNPLCSHSGTWRLPHRRTGWQATSRAEPRPSRTFVVAEIGAKIKPRSSAFSEEQNSRDICCTPENIFLLLLLVLAEASAKCNLMSEAYYLAAFHWNASHSSQINVVLVLHVLVDGLLVLFVPDFQFVGLM